ncbi:MAG TPA: carboxypeptidase regulatory-like domain-containing protein [Candidatus Sulfotelmatobacter sp.]|nr:carboxypeptidase regulatory-like domain-containing protein [Candidatus Sulfotelmatobacter sp.]
MDQGNKRYSSFLSWIGVLILIVGLLVTGTAQSQVISGDIVGTVFDKTGAVVPNAMVEALNVETGVKYPSQANAGGEYRINNLPVGTYNVIVSSPNFATTTVSKVVVELSKVLTLPITLEIKGAVTSIEVTGMTPTLDTTTATVSSDFNQRQIADLPVASITGGVLNLSLLSSGVASSGGVGLGTGPSVGGQRPLQNNFTVEGIDNNSKNVTGPLITVPNDAVAEFTLLQNQYSPEFGHSTGGQFNQVIKSGTNEYHGLAYLYNQNRNYNAVDVALKNQGIFSNPRYDNNRIGGTVGGPILKNKLFFFANFEYNPVGQATSPGSPICSPTAAGYATLDGLSGLSKTNLGILQKYMPAAAAQDTSGTCFLSGTNSNPKASSINVNGTEIPIGTIPIAGANFYNAYTVLGSMDYDISTNDQIRGRYIYNRLVGIDNAAALPVFYLGAPTKNHLVTINEYHTFNPTITNEFRIGYNRYTNTTPSGNFSFPGLDVFPNIDLFDLGTQLGPDSNSPAFTFQNTYQITDNLTWTKGRHTFKFGVEGRKYIAPQQFTQRARGDYDYNNTTLFLQDIQPDFLAERTTGAPTFYGDQSALYWFVNDSWRIRPNVTLNLGLRYQYTTIPTTLRTQQQESAASIPGLIDFREPRAPKDEWGPRIGIAYSPGTSGRTSIRAGFGIGYDVLRDNLGVDAPTALTGTTIDTPLSTLGTPSTYINNYLANGGIPPGAGGILTYPTTADLIAAITSHYVINQKDPESIQWNVGIQHSFWKNYTFESRYLGTRGLYLTVQDRINRQAKVSPSLFLPTYTTAPTQAALDALPTTLAQINAQSSFIPAFAAAGFNQGNVVEFSPAGASTYHGWANQLTRRLDNGLQFIASYTYSHLIDNSTADLFSTYLTPRRPQDGNNLSLDRGNSALDHRHRFTMAVLYDVPYFKSSSMLVRNTLGNWEFGPLYTYQSGEWFTAQSSIDSNLNGDSAGDRTVFNPAGIPGTGSTVSALKNSSGATVAYLANTPTAQFIQAGAGAFANVGRNTLIGRPINNVDLTAIKRFSFKERYKVEFQMQAVNLFNHPQFIPGSLNNVNVISTNGSSTQQYVSVASTKFNNAPIAFASNARTLQLALKIAF